MTKAKAKILCAWCGNYLGETVVSISKYLEKLLNTEIVTYGICGACFKKALESFKNKLSRRVKNHD
jgi:hypothetical protein